MKLSSLHDLYVQELRDLYHAENLIIKALPKMAKAASTPELRSAFEEDLEQTHEQVSRLEQIFEKLGLQARGKKCEAIEGIIAEGKELIGEDADPAVRDAGLICTAQKIEHYEMAGYGTVRTFARLLGDDEAADLLQQTLDEERESDHKLTDLAMNVVNTEALAGSQA